MKERDMIDFNRACLLLNVHEKASGHPKLRWLADAAMNDLIGMEPKPESKPVKVVEPELDLGIRRKL